jgi:two-component system cell cycle response regulator
MQLTYEGNMAGNVGVVTESIELFTTVEQVLRKKGFRAEYMKHITRDALRFDAILWEVGIDSMGAGERLPKLLPALSPVPVLGFSQNPLPDSVLVQGLEHGMHDFVEAGLSREGVLVARIQAAIKSRGLIQPATARERTVVVLNQRDPITGLYSREQFLKNYEAATRQCANASQHLSVAVIHFKDALSIEAKHGTGGVNTFLRLTARAFLSVARGSDALGRIGQERFAMVLPKCTSSMALLALDRLVDSISQLDYPFRLPNGSTPVLHVGIAGTDRGLKGPELLDRAIEMVSTSLEPEQPKTLIHTGLINSSIIRRG